ncbi:hypothetical protein [Dactylosporangium sp. CA-092794]|uniref:hypothetical protein n=1 Tax=Dactylosporangium sp. CA-092794 TaxID=3239929 RepID=UPI003D8B3E82
MSGAQDDVVGCRPGHHFFDIDGREVEMPHVNIKYFPVALSETQESVLLQKVTDAVTTAFGVDEGVVSISLEPVEKDQWTERVYRPEIVNRTDVLRKVPNY